jgi:hypothetical protein
MGAKSGRPTGVTLSLIQPGSIRLFGSAADCECAQDAIWELFEGPHQGIAAAHHALYDARAAFEQAVWSMVAGIVRTKVA